MTLCPHGLQKSFCLLCFGSQTCSEHRVQRRSRCRECRAKSQDDLYALKNTMCPGILKVGRSGDPQARCKELQRSQPFFVEVVLVFPGEGLLEKFVHDLLAPTRLQNAPGQEWFSCSALDVFNAVERVRDERVHFGGSGKKMFCLNKTAMTTSGSIPTVPEVNRESWKLGAFVSGKGVRIARLTLEDGSPIRFILGPSGTFPVVIPFAPSVFQGTGEEQRKGIVFNVLSGELYETLQQLELKALASVAEFDSGAEAKWVSCLKPAGQYDAKLKAKIDVKGPKQANIFDEKGQRTSLPSDFAPQDANAVLEIRGVYKQPGSYGLMLQVAHLQIRPRTSETDLENPFEYLLGK